MLQTLLVRAQKRVLIEDIPAKGLGVPLLLLCVLHLNCLDSLKHVLFSFGDCFGSRLITLLLRICLLLPLPLLLRPCLSHGVFRICSTLLFLHYLFVVRCPALIHLQPQLEKATLTFIARRDGGGALLAFISLFVLIIRTPGHWCSIFDSSTTLLASEDSFGLYRLRHLCASGCYFLIQVIDVLLYLHMQIGWTLVCLAHLPTSYNCHWDPRPLVPVSGYLANGTKHVHTSYHLAKCYVLSIEERMAFESDEEL
mmetsp:Transcript_78457/g.230074  ORF Transcript_78457/g.230074 Transcript_78457/m.230074 type:complete len:254 (+) Transcript_78457:375-1136(+)